MKIVFGTYTYPPFMETGGPPIKIRAMAEGLAARGHEVAVLTANHARPSRERHESTGGVAITYLRELYKYRFVPFTVGAARWCRTGLEGVDVVHLFGTYDNAGPVIARRARGRGIPYVIEPLGMHRAIIRSHRKKQLYHATFGRGLMDGAARIIATAEFERRELIEDGLPADRVVLRRNGIDLRRFVAPPARGGFRRSWGIPADAPLTLFLGRLALKKHPELLLEAFADADAPGWLVFVGPDEDENAATVRAAAARRGLADRVVITGPIYDEDAVTSAYVDADLFVLPSESENFGNSVVEAMAAGTPVIVTDRCGVAEFVPSEAGRVVPLARADIADALRRAWSDDAWREEARTAAPRVAAGLGWDEPLDQTEAMYRLLVRG